MFKKGQRIKWSYDPKYTPMKYATIVDVQGAGNMTSLRIRCDNEKEDIWIYSDAVYEII